MISSNTVLLLKSETDLTASDEYTTLLVSNGFKVKQVKTLQFNFINFTHLHERLQVNHDNYSGIVLVSPRCVQAVQNVLQDNPLNPQWFSKANFVVGEATHKAALSKLGLDCRGKEAGSAYNLAQIILEDKALITKPLLYPQGNLSSSVLAHEIFPEGLRLDGLVVYENLPSEKIEAELSEVTDNFSSIPEFFVFFSASGVSSCTEHLRNLPVDLNQIKFIAIGPATAKAILKANLKVFATAKQPNPEGILLAIKDNKTESTV